MPCCCKCNNIRGQEPELRDEAMPLVQQKQAQPHQLLAQHTTMQLDLLKPPMIKRHATVQENAAAADESKATKQQKI